MGQQKNIEDEEILEQDLEAARFAEAVGLMPDSQEDLEEQFIEVPSFLRQDGD